MRNTEIVPLVAELQTWMRRERTRFSRHTPVAKAMDYMLKRWDGFARFLVAVTFVRTGPRETLGGERLLQCRIR